MRHPHVDYPAKVYNDYYAAQVGGQLPYFAGARNQRGHGLGDIFGKLFRSVVMPTVGRVLKKEIPHRLVSFGSDVLGDVSQGRNIKQSLKNRGLQQLKGVAQSVFTPPTATVPTRGPPGLRVRKRKRHSKSQRVKRAKRDIFSP
jgi:hypothetical protein